MSEKAVTPSEREMRNALESVVNYTWADEAKDYSAIGTDSYIFTALHVLARWLGHDVGSLDDYAKKA
jgi:hypothetical protein